MVATVLVVDSSDEIRDLLRRELVRADYDVVPCRTGADAQRRLEEGDADVAVLEWNLPDGSGDDLLRMLRMHAVPVLILSDRADPDDRVRGLELGAEDYVTKPFNLRELELRIAAVLRRGSSGHLAAVWSFGGGRLAVDQVRHEVTSNGDPVTLTPGEWNLLVALASCPGRVFSRHELISWTHDDEGRNCERTVDTHVMNLRHKIGDGPQHFDILQTVTGVGYRFGLERDDEP